MAKRKMTLAQLRNLPQYKGLTEEELSDVQYKIEHGDFEDRVAQVLKSFEDDYDLSNMSINDTISLEGLARLFVMIEDADTKIQKAISAEEPDWGTVGAMNRTITKLREDASRLQHDLNITRKARQGDEGQSVVDYIEDLKERAKNFLQERLCEVYCPKCKMLLAKVWVLYPGEKNVFSFTCGRDGCGYKFEVDSKTMRANKNKNIAVGPPF